jgi:hypothetical protein
MAQRLGIIRAVWVNCRQEQTLRLQKKPYLCISVVANPHVKDAEQEGIFNLTHTNDFNFTDSAITRGKFNYRIRAPLRFALRYPRQKIFRSNYLTNRSNFANRWTDFFSGTLRPQWLIYHGTPVTSRARALNQVSRDSTWSETRDASSFMTVCTRAFQRLRQLLYSASQQVAIAVAAFFAAPLISAWRW